MAAQPFMAVVVVAFYRRLLDGSVYALNLTNGPQMVRVGQPVLNPVRFADQIKPHGPRIDGVPVSGLLCELDTVVRQDRLRRRLKEVFMELPGRLTVGFLYQLHDCERTGAVDGYEEIDLTLFGPDLGNVDVEEANRVALELLSSWFVAFDIRETRHPMPLQTAMQVIAREMRHRRLQSVKTIIQRQ